MCHRLWPVPLQPSLPRPEAAVVDAQFAAVYERSPLQRAQRLASPTRVTPGDAVRRARPPSRTR
eukprot:6345074-Prymnesium_polylepis.2